jgi:FtsP/CotA-like multicopper oxidase with cupredoxin domain
MTEDRVPRTPRSRRLLPELVGAAALGAVILAGASAARTAQGALAPAVTAAADGAVPADTPRVRVRAMDLRPYADSLREPAVIRPVNGVLNATVTVEMARLPIPRGRNAQGRDSVEVADLRSFRLTSTTDPSYSLNDPRFAPLFPGPTYRVRRGDLVRIELVNALPDEGPQNSNEVCKQATVATNPTPIPDIYQACFHGLNFTNIHYHGMHVTPDSTSTMVGDDVLMTIPPGGTLQYSFRIPQNQSPGTHWYHPHKHGSVAIQVANGMAGAFIVEDPESGLDSIVRHHRMREHLIAIQQVAPSMGLLGAQGELDGPAPLVNGQYQPTIYMAPGEVQRWRIVSENATRTGKTFDVGFMDTVNARSPRLYDVARDGVQFAPDNYDPDHPDAFLHMAPGQRLDVFVKAPDRPGTHSLQVRHNPGASRRARFTTLAPDRDLDDDTHAPSVVLFRVVVDPSLRGRTMHLPRSLPPQPGFLQGELAAARDTAVIVFTDSLEQEPTQFYLGSRLNPFQRYNDNDVFVPSSAEGRAMPMVLGETQTWKIVNNSQQGINHPFHIHINPFQVNRVVYPLGEDDPFHALYEQLNEAAARGNPIWLDVLPLPIPATDTTYRRDTTAVDTVQTRVAAYAVITQKYDDFQGCPNGSCGPPTGYFVMHCHILGHEERGMMQVLQVVRPGQPVSPPEGHVSHGAHGSGGPGTGRGQGTGGGQGSGGGQGQPRQVPQPEHRH